MDLAGNQTLNVPETPSSKRKRGLSLRSQLLYKSILGHTVGSTTSTDKTDDANIERNSYELESNVNTEKPGCTPSPSENKNGIELSSFPFDAFSSVKSRADNPAYPPRIQVDSMVSRESGTTETYNIYGASRSRSSSRLSATSLSSESKLGLMPHRKRRNKYVKFITKLKDKVFGRRDLPPSKNGRVIPLNTNLASVNDYYQTEFYDDDAKALIDERSGDPYRKNVITSAKYTVYSFFPKQIKAQFSKIANVYFLIVAIMQMIPSWSTTGHYTTIIPLLIFISISIAREGFDDWKRHLHDKEENNKKTSVIRENDDLRDFDTHSIKTILSEHTTKDDSVVDSRSSSNSSSNDLHYSDPIQLRKYNLNEYQTDWKKIRVGDIVKVKENEWFPADVVLLASPNQEAYVETMALDGETNLKSKFPNQELAKRTSTTPGLRQINSLITVEDPNADLYNFEGKCIVEDESHPLGPDNVIYRGSVLRNTYAVLGLVVFTGEETKIRMNNIKSPRTKAPKLQKNVNYIVAFMVCVVILLSAFSTMAQRILYKENKKKAWYLMEQDAGVAATLMGFIIMYNTLIPLSLYVTMEIIKLMQLCFLQFDVDMYDPVSNTPADAKTATILEELGQVSFVFSDKTGTLTDNHMEFKKFSVCGTGFSHELESSKSSQEDSNAKSAIFGSENNMELSSRDFGSYSNTVNLLKYIQLRPDTIFSKNVKFFLLSIALCNSCIPRKERSEEIEIIQDDKKISYQSTSPDEAALVSAARDMGFVVFEKESKFLTVKTYPEGFSAEPFFERYEILDVIEFTSSRKRMSVIVKFPDDRICLICKGADNVIIDLLKDAELAKKKARDISMNSVDRKTQEADVILQSKLSGEIESSKSIGSIRRSLNLGENERFNSIDSYLSNREDLEVAGIASKARESLHLQQSKRYSFDERNKDSNPRIPTRQEEFDITVPPEKLLVNEEFLFEKTLEHIEEFSTEGLRTLMYSFRWLNSTEYENWAQSYAHAKTALVERGKKLEEAGELVEYNLQMLGATAIEDKLQIGVSESIEKLRRAGIKVWMLTGDKRETAINIGYSCCLIKDYSTVVVFSKDEDYERLMQRITSVGMEIKAGRVAHCVIVIDGATLAEIENDSTLFSLFLELCVDADSAICCRAAPSQKANMVSSVRSLKPSSVTLAIGDGANDVAMIQSADIGVGITGKEGLQAAKSLDYAIAQFRFLLKLLLVNGRYNYVRTSKFVLCTFYKELLFYLSQAIYQRNTLFTGSSMYESWSLSMFNTLFTSLPVLCVGMFDMDLRPSTLLAVPELYSKGRLYEGFNLRIFVTWMLLSTAQSLAVSFMAFYVWGFTSLVDNSTLPLGTMVFGALVCIINAKCEFIELHNRQWLAFAAFILSVGGYGVWNVLIMFLYRKKDNTIFYVSYGLLMWGRDQSWEATLLAIITVPLMFDILIKVFKFMVSSSDDETFRVFERDTNMRRYFEELSEPYLHQGWTFPKENSTTVTGIKKLMNGISRTCGLPQLFTDSDVQDIGCNELQMSASQRKRKGTIGVSPETSGADSSAVRSSYEDPITSRYEILPSGKRVKIKDKRGMSSIGIKLKRRSSDKDSSEDEDVDAIITERLNGIVEQERRNASKI